MKLLVLNYKQELNWDLVDKKLLSDFQIEVLNENKGWNFWYKLMKVLTKNKYDLVVHWGLAGGKEKSQLWRIYLINRAFFSDWQKIFDGVKYRYVEKLAEQFWISDMLTNIVTKIKIGAHSSIIYDFWNIYDLESFWVANITNFFSFPIFTFKGVSDLNDVSFFRISEEQEIEYLLKPSLRRNKKKLILEKLQKIIDGLTVKFIDILKKI